ncbi:hypothetical protein VPHD239_0022 [Vibrio phage D239]
MSELKDFLNSGGTHAPQINENTERLDTQITNPNLLINGEMAIWQRGEDFAGSLADGYFADRWQCNGAFTNVQKGSHSLDDVDAASQYVLLFDKSSGASAYIDQPIETSTLIMNNNTVSFSLVVRDQATLNNLVSVQVINYEKNAAMGSLDLSAATVKPIGATTRLHVSGTFNTSAVATTSEHTVFRIEIGTGAMVAGWVNEVKLELGAGATPFVPDTPADALAKCQRYFYRSTNTETLMVSCWSTPSVYGSVNAPIAMRKPPIWLFEEASFFYDGGSFPVTPAVDVASTQNARFTFNHTATVTRTASGWLQTKFSADAEL